VRWKRLFIDSSEISNSKKFHLVSTAARNKTWKVVPFPGSLVTAIRRHGASIIILLLKHADAEAIFFRRLKRTNTRLLEKLQDSLPLPLSFTV